MTKELYFAEDGNIADLEEFEDEDGDMNETGKLEDEDE